jgi:O-antigen/teichoic acid export membrane protein
LKRRTILGALWTSWGYVISNALRTGAHIAIAWLLYPEAFGIIAAVHVLLAGLNMLSDLGVIPVVVRDPRGGDPDFLNTAWTIGVIRGYVLYAFAVALAWPLAEFYREPALTAIFPVASLALILNSFRSPALMLAIRRIAVKEQVLIEFFAQIAGIIVILTLAALLETVAALVAGILATSIVWLVLSYTHLEGPSPRFRWDRDAWRAIWSFGKWIFLSTALTFVAGHTDRLILGRLMTMAWLGIYSIARNLTDMVEGLIERLARSILFPAFSEIHRTDRSRLKSVYYRTRLKLDLLVLPACGGMIVLGRSVIPCLYDERYEAVGWIFQILVLRVTVAAVVSPCQACLVSMGNSRIIFFRSLARAIWVAVSIPICWQLWGLQGLCGAGALSEVPALAIMWVSFWRSGLLDLKREALAVVFYGVGVAAGWLALKLAVAVGILTG